jgi:hypothetical protein
MKTYRIIATKQLREFAEFLVSVSSRKELYVQLDALQDAGYTEISFCKTTL